MICPTQIAVSETLVCACGCGEEFTPKRKEQKYKNPTHAVRANRKKFDWGFRYVRF